MNTGELILYTTDDGLAKIQLHAIDGTVWVTQNELADLFQKSRSTIVEHIENIYAEGELIENSVCRNFRRTAADGKSYDIQHYNLDLVLAVGYRVKSARGVQFRKWATTILKEYLIKGFAMDDARLKNPNDRDYFDELLARIRDIRASEKRFYQKVKDLYMLSTDYDPKSENAQLFFKTVQNKLLWAITGRTAAELLVERSHPSLPNMGLSTWDGAKVRKKDVVVAKNYLLIEEITKLNKLVTMYLDYAEDQAQQRIAIYMHDWENKLDQFLAFNNRDVLNHAGSISHQEAEVYVHQNFAKYDKIQKQHELEKAELEAIVELELISTELDRN